MITRILLLLCKLSGLASGVLLIYMTLATITGVGLRYFFNSPSQFVFESTEMALALCAFLAIPYTASKFRHVSVQIIPDSFGRANDKLLRIANMGGGLFSLFLTLIIGDQFIADLAADTRVGYGGGLPRWIPMAVMAFGFLLYGLWSIRGAFLDDQKEVDSALSEMPGPARGDGG